MCMFLHVTGLNYTANWQQNMETACRDYEDIMDLDNISITYAHGIWDFSMDLIDDRTFRKFFKKRRSER